jgi:hypothetical protein
MTQWAETQGKMLSGHIESSQGYDQSTSSYKTYHRPEVTYQYEVNGIQYTGTRVTQQSFSSGALGHVKKFLADHPVGSTVTVYYDPANPASSILEKGLGSIGNKQLALVGGFAAGIGGFSIIFIGFLLILMCVVTVGILLALGIGFKALLQLVGF